MTQERYEFDVDSSKYFGLSGHFELTSQESSRKGVAVFNAKYTQGVNGHARSLQFTADLIDGEFSIRHLGGIPRWLNPNQFSGLTKVLAEEFAKIKGKIPVH